MLSLLIIPVIVNIFSEKLPDKQLLYYTILAICLVSLFVLLDIVDGESLEDPDFCKHFALSLVLMVFSLIILVIVLIALLKIVVIISAFCKMFL